jgi:hypothetical protein
MRDHHGDSFDGWATARDQPRFIDSMGPASFSLALVGAPATSVLSPKADIRLRCTKGRNGPISEVEAISKIGATCQQHVTATKCPSAQYRIDGR